MISSIINFGVRAQPTTALFRRTRTGSTYSCNCSNYSCNCQTCCGYTYDTVYRSYNSGGCNYIGGNQWQCYVQRYVCGECNCQTCQSCSTCQSCNTCTGQSCDSCPYSCNCSTCQSCSTCCDFGSWSAWTEVASCTSSTPSCSSGAVQVECQIM